MDWLPVLVIVYVDLKIMIEQCVHVLLCKLSHILFDGLAENALSELAVRFGKTNPIFEYNNNTKVLYKALQQLLLIVDYDKWIKSLSWDTEDISTLLQLYQVGTEKCTKAPLQPPSDFVYQPIRQMDLVNSSSKAIANVAKKLLKKKNLNSHRKVNIRIGHLMTT